jgi:hypothetical protein
MSKIRRTTKVAVAAAGVALNVAALAPGTAQAADYNGKCGTGFSAGSVRQITGGSVYLARKGDVACAITIRNSPGAYKSMSVWVRASYATNWVSQPGNFTTYAGPIYSSTYFGCADYGGRIETSQVTAYEVCW